MAFIGVANNHGRLAKARRAERNHGMAEINFQHVRVVSPKLLRFNGSFFCGVRRVRFGVDVDAGVPIAGPHSGRTI